MNYDEACKILNISQKDEINKDILKRQYRSRALLFHPDKNPESDSVSKFQDINAAYEYLMKYSDYIEDDDDEYYDNEENENKSDYRLVLFSFLKNILQKDSRNQLFYTILKRISTTCEENAIETIKKLDKNTLINVYEILKKYRDVLHFEEDFIKRIENIINEKNKNDECIVLNPTINDLLDNNLYKLKVNGFTYIIPLWHHELVYDNSGNDIYVKCQPILPENVEIDEKNNILMNVEYNIRDLWGKETVTINIGNKQMELKTELLKLTKSQRVFYSHQGISKINTTDIYDIKNRGDIIINIELEL